jgi:hypothetical protein
MYENRGRRRRVFKNLPLKNFTGISILPSALYDNRSLSRVILKDYAIKDYASISISSNALYDNRSLRRRVLTGWLSGLLSPRRGKELCSRLA